MTDRAMDEHAGSLPADSTRGSRARILHNEGHLADATLLLSGLAFLLTVALEPSQAHSLKPCEQVRETEAHEGWTRRVVCLSGESSGSDLRGPGRLLFGLRLDVNSADEGTLQSLPGVGPKRARAIVGGRCELGFSDLDDLDRLSGWGVKTVEKIRPFAIAGSEVRCSP